MKYVVVLVGLLLSWFLHDRVTAPTLPNNKKVIYLGPGCGHIAYTMGFVGGLLKDAELKAMLLESGAVFGGTSSGAATAAYATAALHGCHSMDDWWFKEMRRGFEIVQNYSTMAMGTELRGGVLRYYRACSSCAAGGAGDDRVWGLGEPRGRLSEAQLDDMAAEAELIQQEVPWLATLPVSVTTAWPPLRPRFFTRFQTAGDFMRVLWATSYVPGVMGTRPVIRLPDGQAAFDGFLGLLRVRWPDSYLFVSFLPTIPSPLLQAKHELRAYDYDSTGGGLLGLVSKSWPWGDPPWADAAFHRGDADATANMPELRAQIAKFLQD
jgi:hypothetical protein